MYKILKGYMLRLHCMNKQLLRDTECMWTSYWVSISGQVLAVAI